MAAAFPSRTTPCHPWPSASSQGLSGIPEFPIVTPILRLIPGHTRQGIEPLSWGTPNTPCEEFQLEFSSQDTDATQTITLGDGGFADHWVDISSTKFDISVNIRNRDGAFVGSVAISDEYVRLALSVYPRPCVLRCPVSQPAITHADVSHSGMFTSDAVLITPLPSPIAVLELQAFTNRPPRLHTYRKHPLVAGHRGCGAPTHTEIPENTLLSFVLATRSSVVSHVELDVQLLGDGNPAIYHDFLVAHGDYRNIYQMDTATFKTLRPPDMLVPTVLQAQPGLVTEPGPLPTLSEACQLLPVDIGFITEIKYPTPEDVGEQDIVYPSRNKIVDAVLNVLLEPDVIASNRDVIFMSFDPDICILLASKQRIFNVYLGNSELREIGNDLYDPRTQSFSAALSFASTNGLMGLVILADMVLEDPTIVAAASQCGLSLMTYSPINADSNRAKFQLNAGVDGLIVDGAAYLSEQFRADVSSRQALSNGP